MVDNYRERISIGKACYLFSISTSVYYYTPQLKDDTEIITELTKIADDVYKRNWGFWMMYHSLRGQGFTWNHKRLYRVYCELGLNKKRRKHKRRLPDRFKEPLIQPLFENITWSMDFMHDTLRCGRKIRTFNVIDDFNREVLNVTIATSINSERVIEQLEQLIEWRGKPERLRVDNGPEFIAIKMQVWCDKHGIELHFIEKGSPYQNGYIERFNRTYREEVLDAYLFESIEQLKPFTQNWMWVYNNERPHTSIQNLPPVKFAMKYRKKNSFPTLQLNTNQKQILFLNIAN